MKAALQVAAILALLTFSVGGAVVFVDVHHASLTMENTLRDLDEAVKVQNVDLAANQMQLNATLSTVNEAAIEQRAYWSKTSADSDKTVKALRVVIDRAGLLMKHTDEQLNFAVLPDLDRQFVLTAQQAQAAFASVGHAGDQLTLAISDTRPVIEHLNDSSAELVEIGKYLTTASAHFTKILGDGEVTADYYEKKLTTPVSFVKGLAFGLSDIAAKAGAIWAGFAK